MKLNKIFLLSFLALGALFTACSDDDHEYSWGKPAGENTVTFVNEENMVLDFEAQDFDIDLIRVNTGNLPELTVPVKVLGKPDFLTIPETVTFAAGDTIAVLKAKIGEGMEAFTTYNVSLMIDEEYTNPYVDSLDVNLIPRFNISFLKEDFKTIGMGTFNEPIAFEDSWEVEIQYSAVLNLYRIPDCIVNGTHWYFRWSGRGASAEEQSFEFTDETGNKASCTVGGDKYYGFFSGYNHSSYGPIYVCVLDGYFIGYNPDGENGPEFDFPVSWRVSAGSFGSDYDYIDNIEWVE